MKCPNCNIEMKFSPYATNNESGELERIVGYRCRICGEYKEVRREPVDIAAIEESSGGNVAGLPR